MSYAWDITLTANTLEATPKEQPLHLHPGIILKIDIKFPAGCHRLVKTRLFRSEFQFVPLNKGEWVTGDDETVSYPTYFDLTKEPAELKFVGCSPGTTYPHTITVRVAVLPKQIASMLPIVELLTRLLQRMGVF